jgi:hypothetical protein
LRTRSSTGGSRGRSDLTVAGMRYDEAVKLVVLAAGR